ncbi:MAG: DNA primase [Planctomycetota bacterium]|jgi:DNA primase|nr:DNA primase [Planctomycetota bacterium]
MPFFSQDFLERVRSANELSQVVQNYNVHMKRAGVNLIGLCPFHNEKTPSFNVRTSEQFFRCFGCGAKGDVFRFVQMMERVEFPEAVRLLAERSGLELEYVSSEGRKAAEKRSEAKTALFWCCSRAVDYFEGALRRDGGGAAREYLLSRGFSQETIRKWRLGWAPDSWDGLSGFLLKNAKETAFKEQVLEYALRAGVLRERISGDGSKRRLYDAFRGRVMFPILDPQQRPVGFGGRVLEEKPEVGGKYINSSEGPLFEKRRILFGLAQAAKEIGLRKAAIVVEGYTDVIMCHQYGIENVVATLGTALTEEHVQTLRRHVREQGRVIALFDADAAGEKATLRAIDLFMGHDVPLSVARGLDVKDACEFLPKFGAEEFGKNLDRAEDSFSYLLRETVGKAKGRDVMAAGEAVRTIMKTVYLCPDPVKVALMKKRVAAMAEVPEEAIPRPEPKEPSGPIRGRTAIRPPARPAVRKGLAPPARRPGMDEILQSAGEAHKRREMRLLRYMWESPDWCARVSDAYPPDEWRDAAAAELAAMARDGWDESRAPAINDMRSRVEHPDAVEKLADMAFPDAEPLSERDLSQILRLMANERRKERAEALLKMLKEAEGNSDEEALDRLQAEYIGLQAAMKER